MMGLTLHKGRGMFGCEGPTSSYLVAADIARWRSSSAYLPSHVLLCGPPITGYVMIMPSALTFASEDLSSPADRAACIRKLGYSVSLRITV
jgi:hypothetical protein